MSYNDLNPIYTTSVLEQDILVFGIGGCGINEYLEDDEYTPKPKFWNSTLIGKLLPFALEGYTTSSFANEHISKITDNTTIIHEYKPVL